MLESQAHRDGYVGLDVDGETMKGDEVWQGREFKGAPEVLGTGFEVREVWGRLKELSLVSLVLVLEFVGGEVRRDGRRGSRPC